MFLHKTSSAEGLPAASHVHLGFLKEGLVSQSIYDAAAQIYSYKHSKGHPNRVSFDEKRAMVAALTHAAVLRTSSELLFIVAAAKPLHCARPSQPRKLIGPPAAL